MAKGKVKEKVCPTCITTAELEICNECGKLKKPQPVKECDGKYINTVEFYRDLPTPKLLDVLGSLNDLNCRGCTIQQDYKALHGLTLDATEKHTFCVTGCPIGNQIKVVGVEYAGRAKVKRNSEEFIKNRFPGKKGADVKKKPEPKVAEVKKPLNPVFRPTEYDAQGNVIKKPLGRPRKVHQ